MDVAQFEALCPIFLLYLNWLLSDFFLLIERNVVSIFVYALYHLLL